MSYDTHGAAVTADNLTTDIRHPETIAGSPRSRRTLFFAAATMIGLVASLTVATSASAVTAVPPADPNTAPIAVPVELPSVTLKIGANEPSDVTVIADTVGGMLKIRNIQLGTHDTVAPSASTKVRDGMTVTVNRVAFVKATKIKKIKKPKTKRVADPTIKKGVTKVVKKGRKGKARVTFQKKIVNNSVVASQKVARKVVKKPRAKVVRYGTKNNNVNWNAVAQCESGQRWHINTGNGYYGGLQFSYSTWLSNGGGKYAKYAHLATRKQQIDIANKLYAARGLQPWGCGWAG